MFASLDRLQPFGAFILRLALGSILTAHGYQKVVPHGALHSFVQMVIHLGLPAWLAYVAAFTEFVGGMLLILGLVTRLVALLALIDMGFAIAKVHLPHGLVGPNGFQLPLACGVIALMLIFTGPGLLALDRWVMGRGWAK